MMAGVVANCNYNIGDVIYREEAFSKVLCQSFKDTVCQSCETSQMFLKSCKQCLSVKYCGKECQKKDWKFHKLECKNMRRLPEGSDLLDIVRLLGNVILQIKGKDWASVKKQVLGKDFSFADINSYSKDILKNPMSKLLLKEVEELVKNFIGTENMPSEEDFLEIFGKVQDNTLTGRSVHFFIGLSKFDKGCIANSNVNLGEHRVKVWAAKKIKKGTEKISIVVPLKDPKKLLKLNCQCTDCSLPYGESVLTKILDEKKAFGVITDTQRLLATARVFPDLCSNPRFIRDVEIILRKQENVLGSTNKLRMSLLSLKCFEAAGPPMFIRPALMELEKAMRSVFGEYWFGLREVYETLAFVHFHLDEPTEGMLCLDKANQIGYYNGSL